MLSYELTLKQSVQARPQPVQQESKKKRENPWIRIRLPADQE
jgi:hypothetical protein